jgi:hypothetical protein
MKQMDRDFFDTNKRINIREYNLDLINGFATSIGLYEHNLLLCAELTHKLLHHTTIHQNMERIWNDVRGVDAQFRERCVLDIVGRVVMTK